MGGAVARIICEHHWAQLCELRRDGVAPPALLPPPASSSPSPAANPPTALLPYISPQMIAAANVVTSAEGVKLARAALNAALSRQEHAKELFGATESSPAPPLPPAPPESSPTSSTYSRQTSRAEGPLVEHVMATLLSGGTFKGMDSFMSLTGREDSLVSRREFYRLQPKVLSSITKIATADIAAHLLKLVARQKANPHLRIVLCLDGAELLTAAYKPMGTDFFNYGVSVACAGGGSGVGAGAGSGEGDGSGASTAQPSTAQPSPAEPSTAQRAGGVGGKGAKGALSPGDVRTRVAAGDVSLKGVVMPDLKATCTSLGLKHGSAMKRQQLVDLLVVWANEEVVE